MVFAPHMDDETLGCGGTIIRKRKLGTPVSIVFMTDGSHSHSLVSPDELKTIRRREGVAAGQALGVAESRVLFCDFEDGALSRSQPAAAEKVAEILRANEPEQVFIPYSRDIHADHVATNVVVRAALQKSRLGVIVYEYPTWYWHHWPWVGGKSDGRRRIWAQWGSGMLCEFRTFAELRYGVRVKDVLEGKRKALNQHRSQMTRLIPDERWGTLKDVSNGEWLNCFFQEFELFSRYRFPNM
jgi:LmbE family N-acetylglucosaminyl deacetylase